MFRTSEKRKVEHVSCGSLGARCPGAGEKKSKTWSRVENRGCHEGGSDRKPEDAQQEMVKIGKACRQGPSSGIIGVRNRDG